MDQAQVSLPTYADVEAAARRIPILEAAARTLRWVQRHEAELRERFGLGRGEEEAA